MDPVSAILELLKDPEVSEIMINGPREVFVERQGVIQQSSIIFASSQDVIDLLKRISVPTGGHDWGGPIISAQLKDGSRVHAVFAPVVLGSGPSITIRKFLLSKLTLKSMVASRSLGDEMAFFLSTAIAAKLNMFISGGTSSGKTSLLNALTSLIPQGDRVITIEDTPELQCRAKNIVRLECQSGPTQEITMRDLIRSAMRMRPDRIIVGETRGAEAFDMLQAMNTGHEGSLTTVHANTPRDCIARVETMSLLANVGLSSMAIRRQIASSADLIVQLARQRDGSRKVTSISEICGMEGDTILLQEIFRYHAMGEAPDRSLLGKFTATGIVPNCIKKFHDKGIEFPKDFFSGAYRVDMDVLETDKLPVRRKVSK